MLKADKYCIQPKKEQQKLLQNNFDDARYVYNRSLALKSYIYKLNIFSLNLSFHLKQFNIQQMLY
jgi:hypothetical protein